VERKEDSENKYSVGSIKRICASLASRLTLRGKKSRKKNPDLVNGTAALDREKMVLLDREAQKK